MAARVTGSHHEKWDGSGYPRRLAGKHIPLPARIAAICDVFDALDSPRSYKNGWPWDKAVDFIRQGAGSHFDPELVEIFQTLLPRIRPLVHRTEKWKPVFRSTRRPNYMFLDQIACHKPMLF